MMGKLPVQCEYKSTNVRIPSNQVNVICLGSLNPICIPIPFQKHLFHCDLSFFFFLSIFRFSFFLSSPIACGFEFESGDTFATQPIRPLKYMTLRAEIPAPTFYFIIKFMFYQFFFNWAYHKLKIQFKSNLKNFKIKDGFRKLLIDSRVKNFPFTSLIIL